MSLIAFIPARGGSRSIPKKNIKLLQGKPLILWVIEELIKVDSVDKIVVATDDESIVNTVLSHKNIEKVEIYHRSEENAKDTSSTESVMLEYIQNSKVDDGVDFMLVQATSPFTTEEDFCQAIKLYREGGYGSILSCVRMKRFFWSEDAHPINYDFKKRPRRQDFNGVLLENGALYISKVLNVIKDKNRLSGKIGIYEMPEYTSLEIDEPDDWEIAEKLMAKYRKVGKDAKIKLFLSDVDGVLTDAGMYYSENGDELKKFSTYDGMGFSLLKEEGVKTGIITSENRTLNKKRAEKLKLDFVFQGVKDKLHVVKKICFEEKIELSSVAYIGDDINDKELLSEVGLAACPLNSMPEIKSLPNIIQLSAKGGYGAVREFVRLILDKTS